MASPSSSPAVPGNSVQNLFNVNGLVAVITGGGSGLGLYAARALDANGAKAVYILGRRESTLQAAAATAINGTIIPLVGDTTDKTSLANAAQKVRQEHGYINLLFANAGVSGPSITEHLPSDHPDPENPSIEELQAAMLAPDMQAFTQPFHVNATGVYYAAAAFLDLLAAGNAQKNLSQDAQILVTSSVAGHSRYLASSFAYATSKAAVNHLCKMLATKFARSRYRIRVNVIAPGLYPSEMTETSVSKLEKIQDGEGGTGLVGAHHMPPKRSPAERTGSEEDFAGTVLFAVSKAGAYLNGATLLTDGGRLSVLPEA